MRKLGAALVVFAVALAGSVAARGADDAATGYARIRPSLVKVWAFDKTGHPVSSGSGIVIVSNASRSLVLTAGHVVAGASSVTIDIDRDHHDIVAHVQQRGPRDLALLNVDRGNLTPATFAARARAPVEGNVIAVAGYIEHDELIGSVGQEPRLLYPGTISARPENGAYLELENVPVEEGLSGAPVFDPESGDVLGIVTTRTADQRGGFADSGANVVLPFLAASAVAFRVRDDAPVRIAQRAPATPPPATPRPAPTPVPTPTPTPKAPPPPPKALAARTAPPAPSAPKPTLPPPTTTLPRPMTTALPTQAPDLAGFPPYRVLSAAAPTAPPAMLARASAGTTDGVQTWAASDPYAHRVDYTHDGCAVELRVSIARLTFALPDDGRPTAIALTLRVARSVAPTAACADIAASEPSSADYGAAATSFDGRHVTIRFRYQPGPGGNLADLALFPSDVSLDADVSASPATAHLQLEDEDWDDALDVVAARATFVAPR